MSNVPILLTPEIAMEKAKQKILKHESFGILADPGLYHMEYENLCNAQYHDKSVREAFHQGVEAGFQEVV